MAGTLLDLLADARRSEPGRPVVTFYDEATGERVELSLTTFDNWVSKVANLFADEIGVEPGERLQIDLPTHWLGPAVVVAGWAAGLVLLGDDDGSDADVRVVGPDAVAPASAETPRMPTVACSLRPLGGRFVEPLPSGWLDFAVEVPPQPDALLVAHVPAPSDPAITSAAGSVTMSDLVEQGIARASEIGLGPGDRVATDLNPTDQATFATSLLAPLAVDASVVLVVNATPDRRTTIVEQERVSCVQWSEVSPQP